MLFARQLATMARRTKLRPIDRSGIARVIEHGARLAGDAEKLSLHLRALCDLLREADFFAGQDGAEVIAASHVQQALDAKVRRADRLRERSYEAIQREFVLVDTDGAAVGQVNGERKSVVAGERVSERVATGGRRIIKNTITHSHIAHNLTTTDT